MTDARWPCPPTCALRPRSGWGTDRAKGDAGHRDTGDTGTLGTQGHCTCTRYAARSHCLPLASGCVSRRCSNTLWGLSAFLFGGLWESLPGSKAGGWVCIKGVPPWRDCSSNVTSPPQQEEQWGAPRQAVPLPGRSHFLPPWRVEPRRRDSWQIRLLICAINRVNSTH